MAPIIKIALTGGPCAGKTTALSFLKKELEQRGAAVFCAEETATKLRRAGKTPEGMGQYEFHRLLFQNQLAEEERLAALAADADAEKRVIICDRGLMDSKAYVTPEEFARYSAEFGQTENAILCAYDAVIHLVTTAYGAEAFYTNANNRERSEDIPTARQRDRDVMAVWAGTPHLRVIDNRGDCDDKLRLLLRETLAVMGIPQPLEIERKFLILYPDLEALSRLPVCRRVPLSQTYLETPREGRFRVRRRGEGEDAVYIKTVKTKISEMKRIETEERISAEEYQAYISMKEYCDGTISKDRYCFVWHSQYFELDVFPFWDKVALLEIELSEESQPYELPEFLTVIREVTDEKELRNKQLAVRYGS